MFKLSFSFWGFFEVFFIWVFTICFMFKFNLNIMIFMIICWPKSCPNVKTTLGQSIFITFIELYQLKFSFVIKKTKWVFTRFYIFKLIMNYSFSILNVFSFTEIWSLLSRRIFSCPKTFCLILKIYIFLMLFLINFNPWHLIIINKKNF